MPTTSAKIAHPDEGDWNIFITLSTAVHLWLDSISLPLSRSLSLSYILPNGFVIA